MRTPFTFTRMLFRYQNVNCCFTVYLLRFFLGENKKASRFSSMQAIFFVLRTLSDYHRTTTITKVAISSMRSRTDIGFITLKPVFVRWVKARGNRVGDDKNVKFCISLFLISKACILRIKESFIAVFKPHVNQFCLNLGLI